MKGRVNSLILVICVFIQYTHSLILVISVFIQYTHDFISHFSIFQVKVGFVCHFHFALKVLEMIPSSQSRIPIKMCKKYLLNGALSY